MSIYRDLLEGGGYTLPFLLHISTDDNNVNLYLINDNNDLEYDGHLYKACNFTYTPNATSDSTLNIELVDHDDLKEMFMQYKHFKVESIGVFYDGQVSELSQYKHKYGDVTWTGKNAEMKLEKDDRLGMTFPALIFNSYNNRGSN